MQRFARLALACSLATVGVLFAACGSPSNQTKTTKTLVFITNTGSSFWKIAQKGCEKADAELADVNVVVKMAFGGTVKEQEKYINEARLTGNTDAIAISPIDPVAMRDQLDKTAKNTL
ncbi:MAG: substrate-binding domain-containing protein, partial [Acidobacteriota bacterium]